MPALLGEPLPDGSVRCHACAHRCLLRPDRVGICGVRQNRDGTLRSLVYGRAVAAHVDPIEKKPLFHVAPGTLAYSIATVGCDFHCDFCQNWEIAQAPRLGLDLRGAPAAALDGRRRGDPDRVRPRSPTPTSSRPSSSSTCSTPGGSPDPAGLLGLYVSNGYATPEAIELLAEVIDAANVDLKSFDDALLPAALRRPARAGPRGRSSRCAGRASGSR